MPADVGRAVRAAGAFAVAAFFGIILLSLFRLEPVPWLVALAFVALAVLAALRPPLALLIVCVAIPIASYAGARIYYLIAWPEALVVAFATGWWLRAAAGRNDAPPLPPALGVCCVAFTALIVTSALIDFSVLRLTLSTAEATTLLLRHLATDYLVAANEYPALQAGVLLLEGLVLYSAAARVVAADPRILHRVVRALVAGAAVAAALSVYELGIKAARTDTFWSTLVRYVATERFNVHYGDINAAGSHYAMMLFAAAGVALASWRRAWWWALSVPLVAAGLWMSGSRTAFLAVPLALGVMLPLRVSLHTRTRKALAWTAGAAIVAAAIAVLVVLPGRRGHVKSSLATQARVEMSKVALRMTSERPIFGVGLGQFRQRSGEFSSPELLTIFPPAIHENAHNNFLQILAELGLLGLVVFVGILIPTFVRACRPGGPAARDIVVWGCAAGVLVFLVTCIGGHPMLVRQPAYSFWLLLGVMAGAGINAVAAPRVATWTRSRQALMIAGAIVLAASIPTRARAHMANANLEHVGVGVSKWESAPDGVRYREATGDASLFIPAGTGFKLKVQPLSPGPVRLELRLEGRLADVVVLLPNRWNDIVMPLRPVGGGARFVRLDLTATGGDDDVRLWITKVEPI
jgi:O-antigen ligase